MERGEAPLARVQDLYRFYEADGAKVPVLRGVTLDIAPKEFVCVMGPSGSGKTTLLHLISGLDRPSGGRVELGGADLGGLTEAQRTRKRRETVGYVFQFFNLLPNLNVIENVGLPLAIAGRDPEREAAALDAILEKLGIGAKKRASRTSSRAARCSASRSRALSPADSRCSSPTSRRGTCRRRRARASWRSSAAARTRTAARCCSSRTTRATRRSRTACSSSSTASSRRSPVLRGPGIKVEDVHAALAKLAI
jgi:putative ABC transport system ATP-binding protein